ncbi:MAG TPA: hypothetical protein DCO68_08845 [Methylophilaceae bacterium]|nr:hypothetical protein [Methylophilaceae bacterium]HAJ72171.1 hypothetical protein [Methylophilaceae bacterium]
MDTQEIPILTEVYKSKIPKAQQEQVQLTSETVAMVVDALKPAVIDEISQALKPRLEAEISEALTQQLTQELTEKIAEQLRQNEIEQVKAELRENLAHSDQSVSILEEKLAGQFNLKAETLEQDLAKQREIVLASAKVDLSAAVSQLAAETAERLNLDIANKVSGMQELAVSQAKSQIASVVSDFEEGFRDTLSKQSAEEQSKLNAELALARETFEGGVQHYAEAAQNQVKEQVKTLLKERAGEFAQSVMDTQNQIKEQLKEHLNQQITDFTQSEIDKQKQTTVEVLNQFYQTHLDQAKNNYAQQVEALSSRLLQDVADYSQKLMENTHQQLQQTQSTLEQQIAERQQQAQLVMEQQVTERIQQTQSTLVHQTTERIQTQAEDALKTLVSQVRAEFKNAINADIPEVEKMLSDVLNQRLQQAMLSFESRLMNQVKVEVTELLSNVKLAFGTKEISS